MSANRFAEMAALQNMGLPLSCNFHSGPRSLILTKPAGFPEAACARALTVTSGDVSRALDWLLANPMEAAAADPPARPVIYTMGFDEAMVQLALSQTGGNEEQAIERLLNGDIHDQDAVAAPSSASPLDPREIFTMGFDPDIVLRALRRAGNREDAALELILSGRVDEGSGDEAGDEENESGDGSSVPSAWPGEHEDFESAMDQCIHQYMASAFPSPRPHVHVKLSCLTLLCRWCSSSLCRGVNPNRQHHEEWLIAQMASCRAAFDQQHPDVPYDAMQHVTFMLSTLTSRYPGFRFQRRPRDSVELRIDRNRVVDSTVDAIGSLADDDLPAAENVKVKFKNQSGYDAGGLTDDWLSMFMQVCDV